MNIENLECWTVNDSYRIFAEKLEIIDGCLIFTIKDSIIFATNSWSRVSKVVRDKNG